MTGSETAFYCFLISLLWGTTNSLIKKSTTGIKSVQDCNPALKFLKEVKYLVVNWRYISLFLVNQLGSALYFLLLQSEDLSLIVPAVNALTFIITGWVGSLTEEKTTNSRTLLGVIFILAGITFCVFDKL